MTLSAEMGHRLSASELRRAMDVMDGDGSGEIDFKEFYEFCKPTLPNTFASEASLNAIMSTGANDTMRRSLFATPAERASDGSYFRIIPL